MARKLATQTCYVLINDLVEQATGARSVQAVDTSSFISAGETVLQTGLENTLNSLALVIGRRFASVRPYKAKLSLINALNTGEYTHRILKDSFYARPAETSGDFNTQDKTNIKDGFDNGTNGGESAPSMWKQNLPIMLEMNFAGSSAWDKSHTMLEYQLKNAFRSVDEFNELVSGILTENANDIESEKEAYNRAVLLNHIAGVYDMSDVMPNSVVNLTAAYNAEYGTTYTSEELRTTYLKSFLEFFVSTFKIISDRMTDRNINYHWSPAKNVGGVDYKLMRHTPKDMQKAILYGPLFTKAHAIVMPEIFNDQYLKLDNYESVNYWQNVNDPTRINITPAIPDKTSTTGQQGTGATVNIPYVVGILFDKDAIMTDFQLDSAAVTPLEAKKMYRNMIWHFSRNGINDFTENAVIFIMQD